MVPFMYPFMLDDSDASTSDSDWQESQSVSDTADTHTDSGTTESETDGEVAEDADSSYEEPHSPNTLGPSPFQISSVTQLKYCVFVIVLTRQIRRISSYSLDSSKSSPN